VTIGSNEKKEKSGGVDVARIDSSASPVNPGRHEAKCTICSHANREEIEQAFVAWISPKRIAQDHSVTRDSIYRHARALNLMDKRRRNVRAALERIIENAGEVEVNAAAVVSAIATYAKLNGRGELVEKVESVNLNALFDRMSLSELEIYAQKGILPDWFSQATIATPNEGQEAPGGS
jgi:hypothetical protein